MERVGTLAEDMSKLTEVDKFVEEKTPQRKIEIGEDRTTGPD